MSLRIKASGSFMAATSRFRKKGDSVEHGDSAAVAGEAQVDGSEKAVTKTVRLNKGTAAGFGFMILGGIETDMAICISNIVENGVAQKSGELQVGDEIQQVNGHTVIGATHNDVVNLIKKSGNEVCLTIRRVVSGADGTQKGPCVRSRAQRRSRGGTRSDARRADLQFAA